MLVAANIDIRRLIRSEHFVVVHAMSASANLATFLARRGARRWLYITSPMGLENSDREPRVVTRLRNLAITKGADRVLVISPAIGDALRQIGLSTGSLLECDLVGLDDAAFEPRSDAGRLVRAHLQIGADELVVTTIGALHPRKSHDLFLKAAAIVRESVPRSRFIVVGEGPQRQQLERLARELGIREHVHFAGQLSDVGGVLEATDVYVKPGVIEGFVGITVLEAMALGRPVAAFDTRDVRMVVKDGVSGLLARSGDERALASAIASLLSDRAAALDLAAKGRSMVAARFRIGRVAENLERVYEDLRIACR
jgi:glycosyltransferase involved in cell wall biosynthesis